VFVKWFEIPAAVDAHVGHRRGSLAEHTTAAEQPQQEQGNRGAPDMAGWPNA
jgi:hypothetical protein